MSNENDTVSDGIDREGIGMLYAGGAGMMAGTSVAWGADPIFGWVGGSAVVALGLVYEIHQRSLHAETEQTDGSDTGGKDDG